MAHNVDRFVTPEQGFEGLYNLANNVRRDNVLQEQQRLREEERSQQLSAKRAATGKFLMDYLDPKDHLTGTNYDPEIVTGFQDLLAEGADLANRGADSNMIMMALSPKVNKLTEYSTKAKLVNDRLKQQLSQIKPGMGYDVSKLEQEARRAAFFDENGSLKDIKTVDPNTDWLTETIRLYPERVTTDAGIDEFVKNSPKFENTKDVTRYTPLGGMERSKVKITSPNWLIPDVDEKGAMTGLVPKYQVALENGQPLMYEFEDGKGGKKFAPVRLIDEGEYRSILSGNPGIADWLRGRVKQSLSSFKNTDGSPIDMNSPQANNVARAILYDELKKRKPGGIVDVEVSKPAQVRNITNVNVGDKTNVNDLYKRIKDAAVKRSEEHKSGGYSNAVELWEMPFDEQTAIIEFSNKGRKEDERYNQNDLKVIYEPNGNVGVYQKFTGNKIGVLPEIGTNIKVQPGVKEKRAVIAEQGATVDDGTIKGSEVPKGAAVTQKGGAYYYNGKKII